jgi:hypothetical protein
LNARIIALCHDRLELHTEASVLTRLWEFFLAELCVQVLDVELMDELDLWKESGLTQEALGDQI